MQKEFDLRWKCDLATRKQICKKYSLPHTGNVNGITHCVTSPETRLKLDKGAGNGFFLILNEHDILD